MASDTEDPLLPYVREWEQARADGRDPTPEDLCRDNPQLLRRLAARIAALRGDEDQVTAYPNVTVPPDLAIDANVDPANPYPEQVGDYKLQGLLGQGGMGAVFRAEDVRLGRKVALKLILPQFSASPKAKGRFLREARSQAGIDHDNVTPIYQVGEQGGMLYIAMPLLQGESLRQRLVEDEPMPLALALEIGRQLAEGLAAAHGKGIVHRDMKPGNVWLEGDPEATTDSARFRRARILDFGLARMEEEGQMFATGTGEILGTPAYMSPEQASGKTVDDRTDLFALGVMMYEMATGKKPFEAPTAVAVMVNIATVIPPAPNVVNPDLPRPVSELIERMLAKDPAERPATARQVSDEIKELMDVYVLGGQPKTFGQPARKGPAAKTTADSKLIEVSGVDGMWAPTPQPPAPRSGPSPDGTGGGGLKWILLGGLALLAVLGPIGYILFSSNPPATTPDTGVPSTVPGTEKQTDLPTVTIAVEPANATVKAIGSVAATAVRDGDKFAFKPAPATTFTVRVEADGYESKDVSIDTSKATGYSVVLAPATMRIVIRNLPAGAMVTAGDTPLKAGEKPGEYIAPRRPTQLTVTAAGYKAATLSVQPPGPGSDVTEVEGKFVAETLTEFTNANGITFRLIPAGNFPMTVQAEVINEMKSPSPTATRPTTLKRGFYLGKTEVTRGQFRKFVADRNHQTQAQESPSGGEGYDPNSNSLFARDTKWNWTDPGFQQTDAHPVVNVTHADAAAFCAWLGAKDGKRYRLPTEAEWEYAATGGKGLSAVPADAELVRIANVRDRTLAARMVADRADNSRFEKLAFPFDDGFPFTAPVGSFQANEFGLQDMFGNVWEWCEDAYGPLDLTLATDPLPIKLDAKKRRVSRGGSFMSHQRLFVTGRNPQEGDRWTFQHGFRVVLELPAAGE